VLLKISSREGCRRHSARIFEKSLLVSFGCQKREVCICADCDEIHSRCHHVEMSTIDGSESTDEETLASGTHKRKDPGKWRALTRKQAGPKTQSLPGT
jgi:hypothetical protein